jgi:hypothetical protein
MIPRENPYSLSRDISGFGFMYEYDGSCRIKATGTKKRSMMFSITWNQSHYLQKAGIEIES